MHVPDKTALNVLHSQIMAQELWTLVSSLRNNLFGIKPRKGRHCYSHGDRLQLLYPLCTAHTLTHFYRIMKKSLTAMYGLTSRGACPLFKPGLPSFALQQALRA